MAKGKGGTGRIIFLNGPSCSGKTTLAHALQKAFPEPYLHLCIDDFLNMLPEHSRDWREARNLRTVHQLVSGMFRSIAALAEVGNHIIADTVLVNPDNLFECVFLLSHLRVTFVGVHCELEELEQRARKRGERSVEVALSQARHVHAHGIYDIEVDSTRGMPAKLAEQIKAFHEKTAWPQAFRRLRNERIALGRPQEE